MILGIDTGGTFTDVVDSSGRARKVSSTPDDPGRAVRDAAAGMADGARVHLLAHGTTVATNALLERGGATVTLLTTEGFEDIIEIARQDRPSLFDHLADRPAPLVDRAHRIGVRERLGHDGTVEVPLCLEDLPDLPADTEAVAVCLLHSDLDAPHESMVVDHLRGEGWDVSSSQEVAPEFREYERMSTTVMNAYLRPLLRRYLDGIAGTASTVSVMTSGGGLVPVEEAVDRPAALLLSGPAAGVLAAAEVATANGFPDAVTFDMGGTSTDVGLVLDGEPTPAAIREIGGLPVRLAAVDVHTIGAGGGSIAAVDAGGALRVGPRSAGAAPGPACYARGGREATVTDANLVAGRIPAEGRLGDLDQLDVGAAAEALGRAGVSAEDVLAVVNVEMEQALRVMTVERGIDPRSLALVAFGGAGPLHACDLADALGIATVLVPARAGVLSAVGLLGAPHERDLVATWPTPLRHDGLAEAAASLAARAREELAGLVGSGGGGAGASEIQVGNSFDCRYAGQGNELRVATVEEFGEAHHRWNGYERADWPVEVTAVRARAVLPSEVGFALANERDRQDDEHVEREDVVTRGPTVLARVDCTVWIADGWTASRGAAGALVLTRDGAGG